MPDVQQRIAAIIRKHYFESSWVGDGCGCNSWRGGVTAWQSHLAEVLVSELGLKYFEVDNGADYWYSTRIFEADDA